MRECAIIVVGIIIVCVWSITGVNIRSEMDLYHVYVCGGFE